MKKLHFILLTVISIQISGQEFAPVGAKWHYCQGTFNPGLISFKTIESVSDTIINGIACRKLIEISRSSNIPVTTYRYFYSGNDSVFFYAEGGFHMLYNFAAVAGDTVTLGHFTTHNGSPLKMFIDSTRTININGQLRKLQYVSCGDGLVIEFGGIVIEGIGNINYMFPVLDGYMDGPLRCYEDNNTGSFINPYHSNNGWNFQDCEQIITGINDLVVKHDIMVFPNPANGTLSITNITWLTSYHLFDLQGRIIKSGEVAPGQFIYIAELPKGVYFLELRNSKLFTQKKVVKN